MKRMFFVLGSVVESDARGVISREKFFYQVWAEDEEEVGEMIRSEHPEQHTGKWYDNDVDVYFQIAQTLGTPD